MKKNIFDFGILKKINTPKKRIITVVAASILLCSIIAGGTLAFLTESTSPTVNSVEPAKAPSPEITENFTEGGTVKKDVKVKLSNNDGERGYYFIRADVLISLKDDSGNIVAKVPVKDTDYTISMGKDWTKQGDYWYYNGKLLPGESTENLINECKTLNSSYTLCVDIVAQSIQADPTDAASAEWGYVPSEN